ncbi:hypothetical protein NIES4103_15910 [Nostoc sp. NIES-4103]|nr:hypothetical protein NIES4103_15910 [Nostoc sp. NIES-4103]
MEGKVENNLCYEHEGYKLLNLQKRLPKLVLDEPEITG